MTWKKSLIVVGCYALLVVALNACCSGGFHYQWQSIILQRFANGEYTEETIINQDGFSLRAHLISVKSNEASIHPVGLFDKLYASDCSGKYLNIDIVEDVDVVLVTEENGLTVESVATYLFEAEMNTNTGNKIQVFDLPEALNNESAKHVEHIDFTLKESFEKEITGQIKIIFRLTDDRFLSDITQMLTLKL